MQASLSLLLTFTPDGKVIARPLVDALEDAQELDGRFRQFLKNLECGSFPLSLDDRLP